MWLFRSKPKRINVHQIVFDRTMHYKQEIDRIKREADMLIRNDPAGSVDKIRELLVEARVACAKMEGIREATNLIDTAQREW